MNRVSTLHRVYNRVCRVNRVLNRVSTLHRVYNRVCRVCNRLVPYHRVGDLWKVGNRLVSSHRVGDMWNVNPLYRLWNRWENARYYARRWRQSRTRAYGSSARP